MMQVAQLLYRLFQEALKRPDPIDGVKVIGLGVLTIVQSGLEWLLNKINNMIGSAMNLTVNS
jgi:hypothetical protein